MKLFFLVIGFFTRLPVPKIEYSDESYRRAVKLIPLVGLVIGGILVLAQILLIVLNVPGLIGGAILLSLYIFLTGGLHFDGLADTCDGVFSGRNREQALEIMKDSRLGVFGMLGIFVTGLFYFVLLSEAPLAGLLIFPLVGRACCLISASLAPYAREEGMGKATGLTGGAVSAAVAVISMTLASFLAIPLLLLVFKFGGEFARLTGMCAGSGFVSWVICSLIAAGAAVIVTVAMTANFKKRLGGVTGDTYGAVVEASSITYLLVFTIVFKVIPI